MKKLLIIIAAAVFFLPTAAVAISKTPTVTGSTGLVRMPTGDVLGAKDYSIAVDYGAYPNTAPGSVTNNPFSYKVTLGSLSSSKNGLELGFIGFSDPSTNRLREGVLINMKYSLSSEDNDLFLAIGVENLSSFNSTDSYMVASKYLNSGAGIHFGAMFDFPDDKFRPIGMLGLSAPLGMNSLVLMGEVFGAETMFQANAGLRLDISRQFSILVRALNLTNNATAKDSQIYYAGLCMKNLF